LPLLKYKELGVDYKFPELRQGETLPEVMKHLSQDKVNLYAGAVGDFNPIHIDESFSKQTTFGGKIAHGMLILAYISEMMALAFGESWFSTGKLAVRFKTPARFKDTIIAAGRVSAVTAESSLNFSCDISCRNQAQETIAAGKTLVRLPLNNNRRQQRDVVR